MNKDEFSTIMSTQPNHIVIQMMVRSNPNITHLSHTIQTCMANKYKQCDFNSFPKYDLITHSVCCGKSKINFKRPNWQSMNKNIIATILQYLLAYPRLYNTFTHNQIRLFADRRVVIPDRYNLHNRFAFGMTLCETETEYNNVIESGRLFFNLKPDNWNDIREPLSHLFRNNFRQNLLRNTDFFHTTPIRSVHEVYNALDIEPDTLEQHLENVLRRTKCDVIVIAPLVHRFGAHLLKLSRSFFRYNAVSSFSVDTEFDSLFLKYGMLNCDKIELKKIFMSLQHQWIETRHQPTDGVVVAPIKFPIENEYIGTDLYKWSGRMRYFRTWKYEAINEKGEIIIINAGAVGNKPSRQFRTLINRPIIVGSGNARGFDKRYVKKQTEWIHYSEILKQMFTKQYKPRYTLPNRPSDEMNSYYKRNGLSVRTAYSSYYPLW